MRRIIGMSLESYIEEKIKPLIERYQKSIVDPKVSRARLEKVRAGLMSELLFIVDTLIRIVLKDLVIGNSDRCVYANSRGISIRYNFGNLMVKFSKKRRDQSSRAVLIDTEIQAKAIPEDLNLFKEVQRVIIEVLKLSGLNREYKIPEEFKLEIFEGLKKGFLKSLKEIGDFKQLFTTRKWSFRKGRYLVWDKTKLLEALGINICMRSGEEAVLNEAIQMIVDNIDDMLKF